ncbi:tRNA (cytosine(49)-C(5))-methyltransferase [Candidatus Tiddalikarchaeum anstoanum]|nr:tRNA (cytosine(49)-C(5))-methyltransferase [Candidatus Tiddalikarchaeum anstoanum]
MSSKKPVFKDSFKEYFKKLIGDELDSFINSSMIPLPDSIRVNTLKTSREKLKELLLAKSWVLEDVPFYKDAFIVKKRNQALGNSLEHFMGYYYVQEQSSMIPPLVLDPKEGDVVLDCCASPGSKTSQLSQLMNNTGVLVGNDVNVNKISVLRVNLQRLGCRNIIVTRGPGQRFKKFADTFDKILVDAPCSGFGAIRKNWAIAKMFNPRSFGSLKRVQSDLLQSSWDALKTGGTIVYSTCTLTLEENEEVIASFVKSHDDAVLENINIKGFEDSRGINMKEVIRIWPHRKNMEGFFVAKLSKK